MTDPFREIREHVPIADAAERYGLHAGRGGMIRCPGGTHEDRHPSAKIYPTRIHCFTCGRSWDAVDLVEELFNRTPIEAARKIDRDYGLNLFPDTPPGEEERRRAARERAERDAGRGRIGDFEVWAVRASSTIAAYLRLLEQWKREHAPKTPDEAIHPLFAEACHNIDKWDHLYLQAFVDGEFEDRIQLYKEHRRRIEAIAKRIETIG